MVNFGEDADCESAVFFRPFLPPSYFLELEILGGFARLAPAPPVLYARNKSRLSRASEGNEEEEGGLRRIRIMEKKFCYRMYYTAIFTI